MGTPSRADRDALDSVWWILPIGLPALVALVAPLGTIDLAYHLRLGASILADGVIPANDTFTFSAMGSPWVDQQWLAQVLLERARAWGGWSGVAALGATLIATAGGLTAASCRARDASVRVAAALALAGFVVAAPMLAVRPQLFGVAGVAGSVWAVTTRGRYPRRVWLLPAIALALANLHGSFPVVIVVAVLAAAEDLIGRAQGRRGSAAAAGVALLATLLNPFGVNAWRYVVDITRNPVIREQISEWAPLSLGRASGILVAMSLVLVVGIAVARRDRVRVIDLLWLVVFLAPAVASGRAAVWWALTFPVVVAGWLVKDAEPVTPRALPRRAVLVGCALLLVVVLPWWRGGPSLEDAPPGVTGAVAALPAGTPLFVQQTWGSWFELATPQHPVYVDSRIELFPPEVWQRYDLIAGTGESAVATLDETGAGAVAGEPDWPLVQLLRDEPGWTMTYEGPDGVVLVRT